MERTWKNAETNPPKEMDRYWCYIEEMNSLGKSHYQWNLFYNPSEKLWSGEGFWEGRVTHWTELLDEPKK